MIRDRLARIRAEYGPDAIAAISSSRATNEENYLFQKLMRAGDRHPQRRQLLAAVPLAAGTGRPAVRPFRWHQSRRRHRARRLFPARRHQRHRGAPGGRQPGSSRPSRAAPGWSWSILGGSSSPGYADVHLQARPGSNVAVFNGLAHVLLAEGARRRALPRDARRRATTSCASRSRDYPPGAGAGDLRRPGRATSSGPPGSTAGPRMPPRSSTDSASPNTRTAPTASGRCRTSPS